MSNSKEYNAKYYAENKEKIAKQRKKFYQKNRERVDAAHKEWIENNREKWNAYMRERRKKTKLDKEKKV